jgi:Anion-transporting ATPase
MVPFILDTELVPTRAGSRDIVNDNPVVHPPGFLAFPTRFLFFTGKGGVGKTSIACPAALALADGDALNRARAGGLHSIA